MRFLITGINGFAGNWLARYLLLNNTEAEIYGTIKLHSNLENLSDILNFITLKTIDIRDSHSVLKLINDVRPDYVFHLAAITYVPASWNAPIETFDTNVNGTINLLEAIRNLEGVVCYDPRILIAGSSEEYGLVNGDETIANPEIPIKETNQLRPMSPYGVSKVAQDRLGWQYFKSYGTRCIITRAFNHEGPRRPRDFVISSFCYQIAAQEMMPEQDEIEIKCGSLDAFRDFSDVRDVVEAYAKILEAGEPGEVYNICSGHARRISDIIALLSPMAKKPLTIKQDPDRMRPSDVPILLGDNSKLKSTIDWKPRFTIEETIQDCLNYWRSHIRRELGVYGESANYEPIFKMEE